MSPDVPKQSRFRGIDLVVISLILGIMFLLCMGILSSLRTTARRLETVNNLKQLGLALHIYQDATNNLPSENRRGVEGEAAGAPVSLYFSLLPYIEAPSSPPMTSPQAIKLFVCPGRHTMTNAMGPITDFGYQSTSGDINAILDAPKNVSMGKVKDGNGTEKTLVLSVISENPSDYQNTSLPYLWTAPSHGTNGTAFTPDSNSVKTASGLGAPFPATPSLYVDGHVVMIPNPSSEVYQMMWSYSNKTPFNAP
jgi:hypothetical protein